MTTKVRAYVDGFNLYFGGLRDHPGRRWLNVQAMVETFVRTGQVLDRVDYFTAGVRGNEQGRLRQLAYLRALEAHTNLVTVHKGRHQEKKTTCNVCQTRHRRFEEKETDVDLAVHLVSDAARQEFDVALLVSGDSDFVPAVRAARALHPSAAYIGLFPPNRGATRRLINVLDGVLHIDTTTLASSQLPDPVIPATGNAIPRPGHWT